MKRTLRVVPSQVWVQDELRRLYHAGWVINLGQHRATKNGEEIRVLAACRNDHRVMGLEFDKVEIDPAVVWTLHRQYQLRHRPRKGTEDASA